MPRANIYPYAADSAEDFEALVDIGGYENADAVLQDTIRTLLRRRPELRRELVI